MTLSDAKRDAYWEQGYLLLPGLFDAERLAAWGARFEALASGRTPTPDGMIVMKDIMVAKGAVAPATPVHAINKILNLQDDPVLFAYAQDDALLDAVRSLVGEEINCISSNVFNKPPGVDGRHPLHQDLRYFTLRPADKIVATWTALGPCKRENGCLAVIPGTHRGKLHDHREPDWDYVNFGFFGAEDVDPTKRLHVEMEPGDTLLFHPLLVHGSGRNRSDAFRRAISVHYASADCERPAVPRKRDPVITPIERR